MTKVVLNVDDSKTMRAMVAFSLKQAGYDVLQAEDGVEALTILDSGRADCIITNLNMPNMDGVELIRNIRANAHNKMTPIIMLASGSEDLKRQAGRHAGANGWLPKPFNPTKLIEMVTKACA